MPVTTVAKRTHAIDRLLAELMSLRGVTAAAIVDGDGFVTHIRKDFEVNSDALGVAVQIMFGASSRSSQHVQQGTTSLVVVENHDGVIVVAPVTPGFTLALVADTSAMLGSLRFEVKETLPVLARVLGDTSGAR